MERIELTKDNPNSRIIEKGMNRYLELQLISGDAFIEFTNSFGVVRKNRIDEKTYWKNKSIKEYVSFRFTTKEGCVIQYQLHYE
jgi:hypothetical protein